jgi:hypothetical protein
MAARRELGCCPSCEVKVHMRKSRVHKGYGDCAECWVDYLRRSGEEIKEMRRSEEEFRRWKDYCRDAGKSRSKEGSRRWQDANRSSSESVQADETVCTTDAVCLFGVSVSGDNDDDVSAASTLNASHVSGTKVAAETLVAIRRGN